VAGGNNVPAENSTHFGTPFLLKIRQCITSRNVRRFEGYAMTHVLTDIRRPTYTHLHGLVSIVAKADGTCLRYANSLGTNLQSLVQ
jgi:hypothetical protein